jgi:hypothetical protein
VNEPVGYVLMWRDDSNPRYTVWRVHEGEGGLHPGPDDLSEALEFLRKSDSSVTWAVGAVTLVGEPQRPA